MLFLEVSAEILLTRQRRDIVICERCRLFAEVVADIGCANSLFDPDDLLHPQNGIYLLRADVGLHRIHYDSAGLLRCQLTFLGELDIHLLAVLSQCLVSVELPAVYCLNFLHFNDPDLHFCHGNQFLSGLLDHSIMYLIAAVCSGSAFYLAEPEDGIQHSADLLDPDVCLIACEIMAQQDNVTADPDPEILLGV